MTIGAKILAALAGLCFLAWGMASALGVQPLFLDTDIEVIYGEHEQFHDDGVAYRKFRTPGLFVLHLPKAPPERRWWTVDFRDLSIANVPRPRSLSGALYVIEGDLDGTLIGGMGNADAWLWRFAGDTASFAGKSLTCMVRRLSTN